MVAFLSLFQQYQIFVQHRFLRERDTVNTCHHRSFLVAAPVSCCTTQHLHGLDRLGAQEVRTLTQIGEVTLCISGYMTVLQLRNQLTFITLSFVAKRFQCLCLGDGFLHQCLFLRAQLVHLVLDSRKVRILDNYALRRHHVVIESVLNSRTDTELNARIQLLQRLCHQVRTGVPESMLCLRIIPFMQLDRAILGNGIIELYDLIIDTCAKNVLRQTTADTLSYLQRRHAVLILTDTPIRKSNFNHNAFYKPTNVYGSEPTTALSPKSTAKVLLFFQLRKYTRVFSVFICTFQKIVVILHSE